MNKVKQSLQSREPMAIALVLFISSMIIGILCSRLGSGLFIDGVDSLNDSYFSVIKQMDIEYGSLFFYTAGTHLKSFFLFFAISITVLGIPYIVYKIISAGFYMGFLLSALCLQYQLKGILLAAAYVCPQALIYVPVIIGCLKYGYHVAAEVSAGSEHSISHCIGILLKDKKLIIILLIGVIAGALVETFLGSFLLRKVLLLF
ncbi:MAG: hypothetical protein E7256_03035 [Lachnospiraceae bacterium]|nr:hypothetical protein [Lachnospiraceae bacterium]